MMILILLLTSTLFQLFLTTSADGSDIVIPSTQQLWSVVTQGSPTTALRFETDAPVPSNLTDGDVLVKVDAAALNPVGYKLMSYLPNVMAHRPHPAEYDFAGSVVASEDAKHPIGERVFGWVPLQLQSQIKQGALSQYVRLPGAYIAHLPDRISTTEGAGITLAGLAAYQGLIRHGGLQPGQVVFINGGTSSVGAYAIQIAKALGCKVWTSASGENEQFVRDMGADVFIDYTKKPLHITLTENPPELPFQVLFDAVGLVDQSLYAYSPAYLAPNGTFVSTIPSPNGLGPRELYNLGQMFWQLRPAIAGGNNRTWKTYLVNHKQDDFEQIARWLEEGELKPIVDSTFSFADVLKAYERLKTRRARGKVIVRVNSEVDE